MKKNQNQHYLDTIRNEQKTTKEWKKQRKHMIYKEHISDNYSHRENKNCDQTFLYNVMDTLGLTNSVSTPTPF